MKLDPVFFHLMAVPPKLCLNVNAVLITMPWTHNVYVAICDLIPSLPPPTFQLLVNVQGTVSAAVAVLHNASILHGQEPRDQLVYLLLGRML